MRYGPRVPCLVLDHSCQRACLVYEDDVVFFAEYLEKPARMFDGCSESVGRVGLEVGAEKHIEASRWCW